MEKPNINYILQLSGDDNTLKHKMINILKSELPLEIATYNKYIAEKNLKLAAECVHKLKHKIAILGLEKSYYLAQEYETHLLECKTDCKTEFENTLQLMQDFAKGL